MYRILLILGFLLISQLAQAQSSSDKIPVIIVPGYLASWNNALFISPSLENEWEFSLGDDTYDNLIASLQDEGYVLGQDLFIAYYDWRQSNVDNYKQYLVPVIEEALLKNPGERWVDVVAHSMGGIFTRAYIQGNDYNDDIRNFVMVATPNHGSADAYYLWSGGVFPPNMIERDRRYASMFLFYRGLTYSPPIYSRRKLIQQDIPSTAELLPTYNYLVDFATGLDLPTAGMSAANPLLPTLNELSGRNGLLTVADNVAQLTIIAGRGRDTIERIAVDTRTPGERWNDGKPIKGGIAYSQVGDGSVLGRSSFFPLVRPNFDCGGGPPPVLSFLIRTAHACDFFTFEYGIESIPGWDAIRQEYIYDAGHRTVMTKAIPIIHDVLSQENIVGAQYIVEDEPEEVLGFAIASPLDPVIIDPQGRKIGKGVNGIGDGASYFDADDPLGPKMIFIENPIDGSYQIETVGTGEGDFHIGVMKLTGNSPDPVGASEDVILPTIAGVITDNEKQDFEIESLGEGLVVDGVVYGDLPIATASATDQIRVNQLIAVLDRLEGAGEVKPSTADILRRSFLSRIKQLDARDFHHDRGSSLYVQIFRSNLSMQIHGHISYINFMTKLRQITPSAQQELVLLLQELLENI